MGVRIRVRELNVLIPKRVWDCGKEWVYKGLRVSSTKEVMPKGGDDGFKFEGVCGEREDIAFKDNVKEGLE